MILRRLDMHGWGQGPDIAEGLVGEDICREPVSSLIIPVFALETGNSCISMHAYMRLTWIKSLT